MKLLRAMLIWALALFLPIEGMAMSSMTHCKDMQKATVGVAMQGMDHHDHAAMMASMTDDSSMAHMHHHMEGGSSTKPAKASNLGCQCGCKCGGDCAVSCAGMMVSLVSLGFTFDAQASALHIALPHSQAHAAYRYDPLRPPSAVAL